jgi:hypothetical protein
VSFDGYSADAIGKFRDLFRGDLDTTVREFRDRWESSQLTQGKNVTSRHIVVQNELSPILAKRIESMPKSFAYKVDEEQGGAEKDAADLSAWAGRSISPDGRTLYEMLPESHEDQEIAGSAALRIGFDKSTGEPWLAVRDTEGMTVKSDPMNPHELTEVRFTWWVDGVQFEEVLTADSRTVMKAGEVTESDEGFGWVPVVLVPRCICKGTPVGTSGVAELLQGYMNVLLALYWMTIANKYAGKVWCVDPAADDGWALADQDGGGVTKWRIIPGAFHPVPIKQVGSQDIPAGALAQYTEAIQSLYRQGKVRMPGGDQADMRSGKAMLIDTLELRDYLIGKVARLRRALEQIGDRWGWLMGRKVYPEPLGVIAEFPDLVDDDPAEARERGKIWLDLWKGGGATLLGLLTEWQRLGLLDQDASPDKMAADLEAKDAESQTSEMARMAAQLQLTREQNQQAPAQPPALEVVNDG